MSYLHLDTGHVHDAGHTVGAAAGNTLTDRARAVRAVASLSVDAADCAEFLAALGLVLAEGHGGLTHGCYPRRAVNVGIASGSGGGRDYGTGGGPDGRSRPPCARLLPERQYVCLCCERSESGHPLRRLADDHQ